MEKEIVLFKKGKGTGRQEGRFQEQFNTLGKARCTSTCSLVWYVV